MWCFFSHFNIVSPPPQHHLPRMQNQAGGGVFFMFQHCLTTTTSLTCKSKPEVVFSCFDSVSPTPPPSHAKASRRYFFHILTSRPPPPSFTCIDADSFSYPSTLITVTLLPLPCPPLSNPIKYGTYVMYIYFNLFPLFNCVLPCQLAHQCRFSIYVIYKVTMYTSVFS